MGEKRLREVLSVVRRISPAPNEGVQRIPVRLTKLRQRSLGLCGFVSTGVQNDRPERGREILRGEGRVHECCTGRMRESRSLKSGDHRTISRCWKHKRARMSTISKMPPRSLPSRGGYIVSWIVTTAKRYIGNDSCRALPRQQRRASCARASAPRTRIPPLAVLWHASAPSTSALVRSPGLGVLQPPIYRTNPRRDHGGVRRGGQDAIAEAAPQGSDGVRQGVADADALKIGQRDGARFAPRWPAGADERQPGAERDRAAVPDGRQKQTADRASAAQIVMRCE